MRQTSSSHQREILVVEDEPLLRELAVCLVEELGYRAREASSADEAIVILEAHPDIRVVFTDINMTGSMDGLQLAAYAYDRWPPLHFIIVSGAQRPSARDMPAHARFFPKPYDTAEVAETLRAMIDG
ncbi:response regulator [Sphingobium phenoxybenzoativorans]|uniref:response regulator n=1 Tax=Sphingobium phenoxybenzoativorans TaxID=1592790 RepID=UPI0008722EB0|nr:response regulator [Sphingobium phenoxybenzoativorans]